MLPHSGQRQYSCKVEIKYTDAQTSHFFRSKWPVFLADLKYLLSIYSRMKTIRTHALKTAPINNDNSIFIFILLPQLILSRRIYR